MAGAGGGCGSSPPPSHKGPSEVERHAERSTSQWYRRTSDATQNAPNVADGGSSFFLAEWHTSSVGNPGFPPN